MARWPRYPSKFSASQGRSLFSVCCHYSLVVVIMPWLCPDYALISRFIPKLRRLREPRLSELLVTIATPEFTCIHPPPFSSCNTSFTFPPPTLPSPSVPSLHFHCTSASRDFLKAMLPFPTVPLEFRACYTCPRLWTSCIFAGFYILFRCASISETHTGD